VDANKAKCWGHNDMGQLGRGNTSNWGDLSGQMGVSLAAIDLGSGVSVSALSSRGNYTCGLTGTNSILCWGENASGQLGRGDTTNRGDAANQMGSNLQAVPLGSGKTATSISAGTSFACAVLNDSSAKCWGVNTYGQLGQQHFNTLGDSAGELGDALPSINLGTGRTVQSIQAGHGNTVCAVLDTASLKCWGRNFSGNLGLGTGAASRGGNANEMGDNLPTVNLGSGRTAKAVSLNLFSACAILDNNSVKCWGDNANGELGQGNTSALGSSPSHMGDNLLAVDLGTGRSAKALAGGRNFTCAILDNDSVKCWGNNNFGQLGLGDTAKRGDNANEMGDNLPTVNLGNGRTAKSIFAGNTHACAILDNDRVKCWGGNTYGGLGQGSTTTLGDGAGEMGDSLPIIDL
jgi:alpha-tubulin suppressor-like RCC1 family protein